MAEYMHLVGAEQVQNAANTMRSAAETMSRAASEISSALERHQRFLEDWLNRPDMRRWEYLRVTIIETAAVKEMGARGGEGWELIDVHREAGRMDLLFKRPAA